jgi:hypothetical protein
MDANSVQPMTHPEQIHTIAPRWMNTIGSMFAMNALARTRFQSCGALMRVDLGEMVAAKGGATTLFDRFERCRMVACGGSAFYLVSRAIGREWTVMLRHAAPSAEMADLPTIQTGLDLARRSNS